MKKRTIFVSVVIGIFLLGGLAGQGFALTEEEKKIRDSNWPFTCTELTNLSLPETKILSSMAISGNPQYCEVNGVIDGDIRFQALLPAPNRWNGKFLMGGGGGMVGVIDNQANSEAIAGGTPALKRGYVTVGTDSGHVGKSKADASYAKSEKLRVNYRYRAVHKTAVTTKRIIKAFYGSPPQHSYFLGCSTGGRQAITEAQRFPEDFDGIVAGAPAHNIPEFMMGWFWIQQALYPDPKNTKKSILPQYKVPILEAKILELCDEIDGLIDGLLADPRQCNFDPAVHLPKCPGDIDAKECFTSRQIAAIKRVYDGPSNSEGQIFPGFPVGQEGQTPGWNWWINEGHFFNKVIFGIEGPPNAQIAIGNDFFKYWVFNDENFDFRNFDFNSDDVTKARELGKKLFKVSPDLSKFKSMGHKLILWTGWSDCAINPQHTIDWYEEVLAKMGGNSKVDDFMRFYMTPGVLHCMGGQGTSKVDWITALEKWVEKGVSPDGMIGSNPASGLSRPICPYPQVAKYIGSGSVNDAANFECVKP